ncbi:MAG: ribose-5-phosphate isomerase RpiA [Pseudomonadota bacterium]
MSTSDESQHDTPGTQAAAAELKRQAAAAALDLVAATLERDSIVGIGTGSTANAFIDVLATHKGRFDACVASSDASAERLRSHGLTVLELTAVESIQVYVDGADEVDPNLNLIKGGGGALTREKLVAASSDDFICIADDRKLVPQLGAFPLPLEFLSQARRLVSRAAVELGGTPSLREGFTTDNGHPIMDVEGLDITDPGKLEAHLNQVLGVVCTGIFSVHRPSRVVVAGTAGVRILDGSQPIAEHRPA